MLAWPSRRSRLTARLRSEAITGRVSCPDQRFILLISHAADPVKPVFYLQVARTQAASVAGSAPRPLVMRYTTPAVFVPFFVTAADPRDLGGAGEPGPSRHQHGLDRATGPAAAARAHGRGRGYRDPGQLLQLLAQGRHAGLDGHHAAGVPPGDGLRGVALPVPGPGRDDRPGQVSERFQQFPDGRDLIGLRVHGDLAEDRADTVRQGRD
jgi:hypothetical protein